MVVEPRQRSWRPAWLSCWRGLRPIAQGSAHVLVADGLRVGTDGERRIALGLSDGTCVPESQARQFAQGAAQAAARSGRAAAAARPRSARPDRKTSPTRPSLSSQRSKTRPARAMNRHSSSSARRNGFGQYDDLIGQLAPGLGEAGLEHLRLRVLAFRDGGEGAAPDQARDNIVTGPGLGRGSAVMRTMNSRSRSSMRFRGR